MTVAEEDSKEQSEDQSSESTSESKVPSGSTTPGSSSGIWISVGLVVVVALAIGGWVMAARQSGSPDEIFEKGLSALKQRRYGEVYQLSAILEQNHTEYLPHVLYLRGAAKLELGLREEAMPDLYEASKNELLRVDSLILAGKALQGAQQVSDAISILGQALDLDPENVDAHRTLGVIFYDQGAMDQAMHHLGQVAKLAPEDSRPHRMMGLILRDFEKYREASIHYREALKRDPYMVEVDAVRFELAESLTELFEYDEALAVLDKTRPTSNALYLRAKCLRAQNKRATALKALDIATSQNDQNLDAFVLYGTILLEEGKTPEAIEMLKRAVEISPKSDIPRYRLAEAYRENGEDEKADAQLEAYKPLRELRLRYSKLNVDAIQQPANLELRYELGQVAMELGRPNLAKMWYQSVLSVDESHVKAREALSQIPANIVAAPVTSKLNVEPIKPVKSSPEKKDDKDDKSKGGDAKADTEDSKKDSVKKDGAKNAAAGKGEDKDKQETGAGTKKQDAKNASGKADRDKEDTAEKKQQS